MQEGRVVTTRVCRNLHCCDGEGEEAQVLCDKSDCMVMDICASLDEAFHHLLPTYLLAGFKDVLMAAGKVPFTTAAFTRNYQSRPHFHNNDLIALCFCVWMYGYTPARARVRSGEGAQD
jgi:hypothetical protein